MLTIYFIVISWSPDSHSLVSQHTIHSENKSKVIIFNEVQCWTIKKWWENCRSCRKPQFPAGFFFFFFAKSQILKLFEANLLKNFDTFALDTFSFRVERRDSNINIIKCQVKLWRKKNFFLEWFKVANFCYRCFTVSSH